MSGLHSSTITFQVLARQESLSAATQNDKPGKCPGMPLLVATCLAGWLALLSLVLISSQVPAQAQGRPDPVQPAFAPVEDNPALPRVLLLGDSISIGYTPTVRKQLAGVANVHRAMENCGPTTRGLAHLDQWLGDGKWDVVHFNFGLHDLAQVDTAGQRVDLEKESGSGGKPQVPLPQYEKNMRQLIDRLRETGATLIWCTTTPVPPGALARRPDDVGRYNRVANRVLRETLGEEPIVNDLNRFATPLLAEIQRPANVHFTPAGSERLGAEVARVIAAHLPKPGNDRRKMAVGVVFHDANENGVRDAGERPLAGVRVSNGRDIVRTDLRGTYRLPVSDDTIIFVIKPRGWRTRIDADMLPQFYYIHKPNGSPKLRYPGVAPTGPLPESVDFALVPKREPDEFKAILFGDPQPRDQREVDYMAHDVIEQLIGTDASLGVTLGDIAFDNLDVLKPQARAIAVLGIPWYNVIGNHDINYDARDDAHSDETFERHFGPAYYSFDHGPVHFIVLDDVEWLHEKDGKGHYQGGLGTDQMAFISADLELIPQDQLVVLMMHIPLTGVRDRQQLYRLIEKRPFCMSISAHQHYHEHVFIDQADGWRGPKPHHHLINVTVCGSWWSGMPDERGIPHTTMADGAPNGYSVISFDGHQYQLDFRAAGRPKDYQMSIMMPEEVATDQLAKTDVLVNVFNGSNRSTVEISLDDTDTWVALEQVRFEDPNYLETRQRELAIREKLAAGGIEPDRMFRELTGPKPSSHLWRGRLPANLTAGLHLLRVRTRDMDGRRHDGVRAFRVRAPK